MVLTAAGARFSRKGIGDFRDLGIGKTIRTEQTIVAEAVEPGPPARLPPDRAIEHDGDHGLERLETRELIRGRAKLP